MNPGHVNHRDWFSRVLGWDGLLPLFILTLPHLLKVVSQDSERAIVVASVVAPISALFLRYVIGRRHLATNRVGPVLHFCQYCVFNLAIFWLFFLDFFLIIIHLGPPGSISLLEWLILGAVFGIYLLAMSFAMYPGQEFRPQLEFDEDQVTGSDQDDSL